MNRMCAACLIVLPITSFYIDRAVQDGFCRKCKDCAKNKRPTIRNRSKCKICMSPAPIISSLCKDHLQSHYRTVTKNRSTHKYEKTFNGFLMRVYRNMKSRVTGIQKHKSHLYMGLPILPKTDFYTWAKEDVNLQFLFYMWEKSGYEKRLTPSIDRIDSALGYIVGNIQWLTLSDNSRKASEERWKK